MSVDIWYPYSFNGINNVHGVSEELMYFSYIALRSIEYGDISPITFLAQKATIFMGLMEQFYMVIITGIVVGKYIGQSNKKTN